VIVRSIRKLKIQKVKLEHVTLRLQQRDKTLFETCVSSLKSNNRERAVVCANELAEVRKLIAFLKQVQLALERVILRLETIKELNDIMVELRPALRTLKSVTNQLSELLPDIASELENVNESIVETLALTHLEGSPENLIPLQTRTPAGEEILKEVSSFLEEKLAEKLPEPPASPIMQKEHVKEEPIKQMVALAATCTTSTREEESLMSQKKISYEEMELQKLSLKLQKITATESLENMILDYVKKKNGEINITECALELNIPTSEVKEVLKSLGDKGKIKIYVK
jgi:division protein CdvB (Snf7/Vps24/ESCRT-III family)